MDSTDSHDAQVQVPGHVPVSGAFEQASEPSSQANPQVNAQAHFLVDSEKPGVFAAGTIIGASYEVIELLGRGAMGMVYRVRHITLSTEYALKILTDDKQNEVSVIRFQNEAQAIAKLNHPNIVAIYNFGVHDGSLPFYVMDLLAGEDLLDKIVCDGPMTPEAALPLFIEACAGLSYAHRKGILHRDVKPANFLILEKPDVHGASLKVVDFGIVKFAEELKPEVQKLTAMGIVCGSPSYMSPEQAMGQKVDPRSDIYSLGCSLFEALTGKVPFRGRSASDTMMMHATSPAPTLAEKNPEKVYSDDLENVVAKMMAKEAMYRYQSMDAVAQDLGNVLAGKPLAASPMSARPFAKSQFGVVSQPEGAVTLSLGRDKKVSGTTSSRNATLFDDQRYSREQEASGEYETDGDDDSEEASEDEREPRSSKFKVALLSLVVAGIVGVASYFAYQFFGPATHVVSSTASAPKNAKDEMGFFGQELARVGDSEPNPQAASIKLTDARYFSKIVTIEGAKFVQFDFPRESNRRPLAWIGLSIDRTKAAVDTVRMPVAAKIYLMPSPDALFKTEFFSKFRPGEICEIFIGGGYACDELVIASAKTAGIRGLAIMDCSTITPKVIPALNSIHDLSSLTLHRSTMDGAVLAKATVWPKLKKLTLSYTKQIGPVLKELVGSRNIEALDLSDSGLGPEEYKSIANLSNLRSLKLNKNSLSADDLRRLSKLSRLSEMSLVDVHIRGGLKAKDIEQFPSLHSLIVDRGHFKKQDIAYLQDHRPSLRVHYYSPGPADSSHDLLLKTPERI